MTESELAELKADFLEWSGGFPPESEYQILVYLEYAASCECDYYEARNVLCRWID